MAFRLKNTVAMDIAKLTYRTVNSMDKYVIVFVNGAGFRFKRAGEELIKASIMLWFLMQRF